ALRMLLEMWGHQVEVAADGPAALRAAASFRPQVALLDLRLPGMDGCELAARLRERDPGMRLVAVTGTAGRTRGPPPSTAPSARRATRGRCRPCSGRTPTASLLLRWRSAREKGRPTATWLQRRPRGRAAAGGGPLGGGRGGPRLAPGRGHPRHRD